MHIIKYSIPSLVTVSLTPSHSSLTVILYFNGNTIICITPHSLTVFQILSPFPRHRLSFTMELSHLTNEHPSVRFPIARSYQIEALEKAMNQNTIVFLETGSGKTLIAIMLLRRFGHLLKRPFNPYIAVFLVPTVVLVTQQADVIKMHTDLKVGIYWGDMGVDFWDAEAWNKELEKHENLAPTAEHFRTFIGDVRQVFCEDRFTYLGPVVVPKKERASGSSPCKSGKSRKVGALSQHSSISEVAVPSGSGGGSQVCSKFFQDVNNNANALFATLRQITVGLEINEVALYKVYTRLSKNHMAAAGFFNLTDEGKLELVVEMLGNNN